jgi:hypothetical protein
MAQHGVRRGSRESLPRQGWLSRPDPVSDQNRKARTTCIQVSRSTSTPAVQGGRWRTSSRSLESFPC